MWVLPLLLLLYYLATIMLQNILQHSTSTPSHVLETSTLFNGIIPVSKYSTKTGLTIAIAETGGPLVNGYLCLATKTHNDSHTAHSLEHLIFKGSEDYPYNGAFGILADRNLGDTNAVTEVDRTCYESFHFGKEGFLKFLPIYLDHILYPTLESSQFTTEVCHVNGEGLDGGVIYSELEAYEQYGNVHYSALMDALYKNYNYSVSVGSLKNLHENTTHQMVVSYHKQFYRPENTVIIICGNLTIDDVMSSIKPIEAKISSKQKLPKWNRPWKAPMPLLDTTVVKRIVPWGYEGLSDIYIAWRGPNCVTEYRKLLACQTLISYLTLTATPADVFAETIIGDTVENSETALYFQFKNVPVEDSDWVYSKFHKRLENISKGIEEINFSDMEKIIDSKIVSWLVKVETSPLETISKLITNDFLYGNASNPNDFATILNVQDELKYLKVVPVTYWINILNEYFINKEYVVSTGISNASLTDLLRKEDKERITNRIETLGPAGLKKKKDELAEAISLNTRPVPDSIVNSMKLLRLKYKYNVKNYRTGNMDDKVSPGLDLNVWPIYAEAYNCRSNYVYITVTFFTNNVEAYLRPYLSLLLKLMHDVPIQDEQNEVIELEPIHSGYSIGLSGLFTQTASLTIQIQRYEYEVGVEYMIDKLQNTVFDADNIYDAANALLEKVSDSWFDYETGALELLRIMYYKPNTNVKRNSMVYQDAFLKSVSTNLFYDNRAEQIIKNVYRLRDVLVSASNLAVHVTADFDALHQDNVDLNGPWKRFRLNVIPDWRLTFFADSNSSQGEVVGLKSMETAYLYHSSPAINDFNHNDLAPLIVALAYCMQKDGPMYRRVRAPGYTYDYKLEVIPTEGVIRFSLYRASDIVAAFNETVNIINELIRTDAVWQQILVDSAKGAAIIDIVYRLSNLGVIPLESMLLSFKGLSSDYYENLIDEIYAVTVDDLKRVAELYLTKIFLTTQSKTAIVCNYDEANGIAEGLKKLGFNLPIRRSWVESLLGEFNDF